MYGQYNCNLYRRGTKVQHCTSHYISHKALYALVLEDIRRNAEIARQYEGELTEYARKIADSNEDDRFSRTRKDLDKCKRRDGELDAIIKKLLEQNALGVISDERFRAMATDYEKEQKDLAAKMRELQARFDKRGPDEDNAVNIRISRNWTQGFSMI
jgi:hypothetical protein